MKKKNVYTAVVAERGQVTIPKVLRDRLGIAAQTILAFKTEEGRLVVEKVTQADPVARVTGCLIIEGDTDTIVAEMRGDNDNGS